MAVDVDAIGNNLRSLLLRLGTFDQLVWDEPAAAPPSTGTTGYLSVTHVATYREHSGLNCTSLRILWNLRIFRPKTLSPWEGEDLALVQAGVDVIAALHTDLTLEGEAIVIDILNMAASAGRSAIGSDVKNIKIGDQIFRVMDIPIPVLVDGWQQERKDG